MYPLTGAVSTAGFHRGPEHLGASFLGSPGISIGSSVNSYSWILGLMFLDLGHPEPGSGPCSVFPASLGIPISEGSSKLTVSIQLQETSAIFPILPISKDLGFNFQYMRSLACRRQQSLKLQLQGVQLLNTNATIFGAGQPCSVLGWSTDLKS